LQEPEYVEIADNLMKGIALICYGIIWRRYVMLNCCAAYLPVEEWAYVMPTAAKILLLAAVLLR